MSQKTKFFFLVYNPHAPMPPKIRFETIAEASKAAQQLARKFGGRYYVMRAVEEVTGSPRVLEDDTSFYTTYEVEREVI